MVVRGGNLALVIAFATEADKAGPPGAHARRRLEEIGGRCDGGPTRALVFTIPLSVGVARVEQVLALITAAAPGAGWYYGNR